jgi:hypothetical protein
MPANLVDDDRRQSSTDTPLDQQGASPLSADENIKLANIEDRLQTPASRGSGFQRLRGFAGRHRRRLVIGGVGTTTVAGLIIGLFSGFLAIFKLDFIGKNVDRVRLARMTHILDRRSDRFITSLVMAEVGGNVGGDTTRNRYFVAKGWDVNHPFAGWYRDLRTSSFFDELERKEGYRFVRQTDGGIDRLVKIETRGVTLNFDDYGRLDTSNIADFERRIIEVFDRNADGRRAFNQAIESVTGRHNLVRRRHVRAWGRESLGITRWTFFENQREDARNRIRTRWTRAVTARHQNGSFIRCLTNASSCPDSTSLNDDQSRTQPPRPNSDESRDLDEAERRIRNGEAPDGPQAGRFARIFANQTMQRLLKTINIIGIVDLLDTIHRMLGNGALVKLIAVSKAAEYAASYVTFQTAASQLKEGANVSGEEVDAFLEMFDNFEKGESYEQVFGEDSSPTALKLISPALAAEEPEFDRVTDDEKVNSEGSAAQRLTNAYNSSFGAIIGPLVEAYRKSGLDSLVRLVSDLFGAILDPIFKAGFSLIRNITGFSVEDAIKSVGEDAINVMGGSPNCTGETTSAQRFSCIDGGAAVTQENFLQSKGGHLLSPQEASILNHRIALEEASEHRRLSPWTRLASLTYERSLASRLLAKAPSNTNQLASSMQTLLAKLSPVQLASSFGQGTLRLPSLFSFNSYAADALDRNLYGLKYYGFTDTELESEPFGGKTQAACDQETSQFKASLQAGEDRADAASSLCLTDSMVANSLISMFTDQDDGGLGAEPFRGSSAPISNTPSGNAQDLARQLLANPRVSYWTNLGVNTRDVVVAISEGRPAYTTCGNATSSTAQINPNMLLFLVELGGQTGFQINALTDKCHSTGSNHYSGKAVDFECNAIPFDIRRADPIAQKYGGRRNGETCSNDYHWHYDFLS